MMSIRLADDQVVKLLFNIFSPLERWIRLVGSDGRVSLAGTSLSLIKVLSWPCPSFCHADGVLRQRYRTKILPDLSFASSRHTLNTCLAPRAMENLPFQPSFMAHHPRQDPIVGAIILGSKLKRPWKFLL